MEYEYGVRIKGSDLVYSKSVSRELAEDAFALWTKEPGDYKPVLVRRPIATEWETF